MPDKVILQVVESDKKGEVLEFIEPDSFVFGRMPDCQALVNASNTADGKVNATAMILQ